MDETIRIKQDFERTLVELISDCKYCVSFSTDSVSKTPIQCIKFAGSAVPIAVNVAACLNCGEYKLPN